MFRLANFHAIMAVPTNAQLSEHIEKVSMCSLSVTGFKGLKIVIGEPPFK